MTTKILSLGDYYLDKSGWFVRKSPWIKRVKILFSILFLSAIFYPNEIVRSHIQSNLEYVSSKYSPPVKDVIYRDYILSHTSDLTGPNVVEIVETTKKWASEFGVDEKMLFAIMTVESTFYRHAISNAGAMGLMQVVPRWHLEKILEARKRFGNPELFDTNTNIFLGAWIYKDCLNRFKKQDSALLCYNGSNESPNGYDKKVMIAYNNLSNLMKKVK